MLQNKIKKKTKIKKKYSKNQILKNDNYESSIDEKTNEQDESWRDVG